MALEQADLIRAQRDHFVQLRTEELKMMLPGQPMLALYEGAGAEPATAVREKLRDWFASYRQKEGPEHVPDYSGDILRAQVFLVPLARNAAGEVVSRQVCVKFTSRGTRDELCRAFGRCEARRLDPTWRQVRVQASLTTL